MIDLQSQNKLKASNKMQDNEQIFKQIDDKMGLFSLYSQEVLQQLQKHIPKFNSKLQQVDLDMMPNNGITYYKHSVYDVLIQLQDNYKDIQEDQLIQWFSRYADLICVTQKNQEWYQKLHQYFDNQENYVDKQNYFQVLANTAHMYLYCSNNKPEDSETVIDSNDINKNQQLRDRFLQLYRHIQKSQDQINQHKENVEKIISVIQQQLQESNNVSSIIQDSQM